MHLFKRMPPWDRTLSKQDFLMGVPDPSMVTGGPPVEGGADSEESRRGQVLQDGDERLQLLPQASSSGGAGQAHREGLVGFWLSVQDRKDLQCLDIKTKQNNQHLEQTKLYCCFKRNQKRNLPYS